VRVGIAFTGAPYTVRQIVDYAVEAERLGLDSIWIAEDYFLRDSVSVMAYISAVTKKVRLAFGVINPLTRNPVLIAQTVATIDEISGGRVILALGTGVLSLIEMMGITVKKPLKVMRESIEIIRELLKGCKLNFKGEVFEVRGVKLGLNPYLSLLKPFKPLRTDIPIYLGAVGPKMLSLAGEVADGVLLTAGCSTNYVRWAIERLRSGAEKAGRRLEAIDVACYILYSPNETGIAHKVIKGFVAFSVAHSDPEILKRDGFTHEEIFKVRDALDKYGLEEASRRVSSDMVETYSIVGGPRKLRERIIEYVDAGVKLPIIMTFEPDLGRVFKMVKKYLIKS